MALRRDAKIELIRKVPLFSRCSKRELAEVAKLADELDFPAGKELITEGERGSEFFIVLEGSVDVRKGGRTIKTLGAGDFVGEIALVSRIPRIASVVTTSPVRALVVTERAFRSLLEHSPEVQIKVLEALATRLAETTQLAAL